MTKSLFIRNGIIIVVIVGFFIWIAQQAPKMPTPEPWDGNICSNKRCVNLFEMEEKITQLENEN